MALAASPTLGLYNLDRYYKKYGLYIFTQCDDSGRSGQIVAGVCGPYCWGFEGVRSFS